ncbi:hypothetical protein RhiirC2_801629 [Rhizophagus irregularis]|uniref:Uncharacterized protein n=1 Tax=Rhizophagus irregularis TaxID=588596 RepID=A0A2N1M2C8_9GLOM|nr:hypothetical protein RhiirC2_801629 [Rhizophagus irregularis]
MINLLDNSIPLTLDIYAVLFRSGYFEGYLESVHHLSDIFYWELNNYPIANTLKNNLPIFNDYFVENFHSSIRNQTVESNINVDVKVLLLAWNTEHKPADDKFCDAENCLLLNNIDSSNARLTTPLKDNEIPLVEEETNDSSGESNDENIQSILERLEQNIDNQFEILYQQCDQNLMIYDSLDSSN